MSSIKEATDALAAAIQKEIADLTDLITIKSADTIGTVPQSDILYGPDKCGVNIPWMDFGNDIVGWGDKLSLSQSESKTLQLQEYFHIVKEEGFNTVRFWLFPSLWHGDYNTHIGEATDSIHLLCSIADSAGVKLIPTVFSFNNYDWDKSQWSVPPSQVPMEFFDGCIKAFGGWRHVIDYMDLINEPEWVLHDIPNSDPHGKGRNIPKSQMVPYLNTVSAMCVRAQLPYGYGSASRKWEEAGLLTGQQVVDHHNYAWSEKWFPATEAEGTNLVMGETDIPFSEWGRFLEGGKYRLVMAWLEPQDYRTADVLRDTLKTIKKR